MVRVSRSLGPLVTALVGSSLLLHCSSFGTEMPPVDGGPGELDSAAGDAVPPNDAAFADGGNQGAVTLLEARTTTATGVDIFPELPAPAKVGDALVGFWLASSATDVVAADWQTFGTATIGAPGASGYLWVGSHVVTADDLRVRTPFKFTQRNDQRQNVTLVAYRGARQVDPANPAKVELSDSDSGTVTGLSFTSSPSGPSRAVFALVSAYDNTPFSAAPAGYTEVVRTTASLVVYQQNQMLSPSTAVMPPAFTIQPAGRLGNVAFGIVAAP
jgi:hypothetical protein